MHSAGHPQLACQFGGDNGQGMSTGKTVGAPEVRGKILVTQLEPGLTAQLSERFQHVPALTFETPALRWICLAG